MSPQQQYKAETGLEPYFIAFNEKYYSARYVEWLEKRVEA